MLYCTHGSSRNCIQIIGGIASLTVASALLAGCGCGSSGESPTSAPAPVTTEPDFSLSASPQTVGLAAGATEVFDLSATALNGFSGVVTVTL